MITTQYINLAFDQIRKSEAGNNPLYRRLGEEQRVKEDALIETTIACPSGTGERLLSSMPNVNTHLVKELSTSQFYNPSLMDAISCLTDVSVNSSRYIAGGLADNIRLRELMTKIKQIGSPSTYGVAMVSNLKQAENLFVLKASRNPSHDQLSHELVVGLRGTNQLRNYCPNYAYVYGGFKCSPPVIQEKEVKALCTTKDRNGIQYVIYENIGGGKDMKEYSQKCTGRQFLKGYMQILYALRKGVEICDFTHYDLHYENVLMRPLPTMTSSERPLEKGYLIYMTERGELEKLECEAIATMIDFGMSHIKVGDNNYGYFGLEGSSTYSDRSFPLYDAYKLLLFIAYGLIDASQEKVTIKNKDVFDEIRKIVTYFNDQENLENIILSQRSNYYSLPYTNEVLQLSLDGLTSHIRRVCDCSFIVSINEPEVKESKIPNLVCGNECLSFNDVINNIIRVGANQITTFWQAYDEISRGNKMLKFDYQSALSLFEKEAENYMNEGNKLLKESWFDLRDKSIEQPEIQKQMNQMVNSLLLLKDILLHVETMAYVEYNLRVYYLQRPSFYFVTVIYPLILNLQKKRADGLAVINNNIKILKKDKVNYPNIDFILKYAS